jgi:hypothetical protein
VRILVLILTVLLAACGKSENVRYQTVEKTVEVPKPLPGWATIELVLPPKQDSVAGHLTRENELEGLVKLANCHRKLSERISRGTYADPELCKGLVP